jgi:hypothetical protein
MDRKMLHIKESKFKKDRYWTFCFIRTPIPVLSGHFLGLRFFQK